VKLNIVDDPARVYEMLNTACSLNTPADVRVFKGRIASTYKSRLYEIRGEEGKRGKRSVVIDIPTWDGHFVTLPRGCEMEVHFALKSERFLFEGKLLGRSTFKLGEGIKVKVLLISYPRVLESGQRRAYFRVSPPSAQPLPVRIVPVREGDDDKWTYADRREALRTQIFDIGAGGIGVRVPKSVSQGIDVGTRLKLAFKLGPDEDEIKLTGMVRNRRDELVEKSMRTLGIQFVNVEESPEAIRHVDRIWRYVAEIQRKELASTRGAT
jgi:c-di-GMP-binding flagellar brake protein YcgR